MSSIFGECLTCGALFEPNLVICPQCGSKKVQNRLILEDQQPKMREGFKEKEGRGSKTERKSLYQRKISDHGKEAKEIQIIDIKKNRWFHHVEEQNENGEWKECHHEDESITDHNKKKHQKPS
jgi:predicted  nucleic acid-binding Zn-ribbon protein